MRARHPSRLAAALLAVLALAPAVQAGGLTVMGPSGGFRGREFSECTLAGTGEPRTITELRVRAGAFVDAIQLVYSDGSTSPWHGGRGGTLHTMVLAPDERIVVIGGKYGDFIDSLYVRTSKGRSQVFGGRGGKAVFHYAAPPGMWLHGVWGLAGRHVQALGACVFDPR
ncbi:MAG: hypothetical protein HY855_08600 [Burkholderiales bacterium]|nr:hypothetical protein [Burkholderiales bacterium]